MPRRIVRRNGALFPMPFPIDRLLFHPVHPVASADVKRRVSRLSLGLFVGVGSAARKRLGDALGDSVLTGCGQDLAARAMGG